MQEKFGGGTRKLACVHKAGMLAAAPLSAVLILQAWSLHVATWHVVQETITRRPGKKFRKYTLRLKIRTVVLPVDLRSCNSVKVSNGNFITGAT